MEDRRANSRYAKACRECATTKAKCIRQEHTLKCERCMRLNKECKARVAASRGPRAPKPNRLTQMEQKLDGLVTLLVATQPQRQQSASSDSAPLLTPNSSSPETMTSQGEPIQLPFVPDLSLQEKTKINPYSYEPSINRGENLIPSMADWPKCHIPEGVNNPLPSLDLTDEAAEALLENYQTLMAKYFPFVVIPKSTTAQDLRTAKPFLFLTVMAVSSYQRTGQQCTLSMEIMRRLSDQMLFKGEKSMDLLQGILVYIEWYQSHRLLDPQLTNILQLSSALLIDLGLNKAPYGHDPQQQAFPDTTELLHGRSLSRVRSNDERRAFLGCFYLTSTISSCFKKGEALRYTAHVEESCTALSQHPEYESDHYLVQLVRLQALAEQIVQALPYDLPQSLWTPGTPIKLLVNAFQRELQAFQASVPESLRDDILLQSHIHNTSIHLFEISLSDWSRQAPSPPQSSSLPSNSITSNPPSHRLTLLHRALLAATTLLTTFLTYSPNSEYSSIPFVMWGQTVHAMQVVSKLSLLAAAAAPSPSSSSSSYFAPPSPSAGTSDATAPTAAPVAVVPLVVPGWSLAHVQEIVDFPAVLDRMCAKFEELRVEEARRERSATTDAGGVGSGAGAGYPFGTRYEIYSGRLLRVKAWYEVKLRNLQLQQQQMQQQRGGVQQSSGGGSSSSSNTDPNTTNAAATSGGNESGLPPDTERDMQTDVYGVLCGPAQPAGPQRQMMSGAGGAGAGAGAGGMGIGMGGVDVLRDEFLSLEMLEQMDDAYWHDFLTEWASL